MTRAKHVRAGHSSCARRAARTAGLLLTLIPLGFGGACSDGSVRGASENSASSISGSRYNVVVVLTDDLRPDYLSGEGHPFIQTPAIDRLAREGVVFSSAFVITPLCAPSRATLLTGLPTYAHGIIRNGMTLPPDTRTFADVLQAAGYQTALIGKYGLARQSRPKPGFDHWVAFAKRAEGGSGDQYLDATFNVDGALERRRGFSTDALSKYAVRWIESRSDAPFFLLLSLKNPHIPHFPPPRHETLFTDQEITLPDSYRDPRSGLARWIRAKGSDARPLFMSGQVRENFLAFAAKHPDPPAEFIRRFSRMVPSIDDTVRRVYEALERKTLLDRTIIVFTSDNGILLGEHGLIGKEVAYDESVRVPLIVRVPGAHSPGRRCDQPVLNLDFAPTFLDIAGQRPPQQMTGKSLAPLIDDTAAAWREDWLMMSHAAPGKSRPQFLAVRSDEWKYVRYMPGALEEELFGLGTDPQEQHDLAGAAQHRDVIARMRDRMLENLKQQGMPPEWMEPYQR